jgi:hypothetical protein
MHFENFSVSIPWRNELLSIQFIVNGNYEIAEKKVRQNLFFKFLESRAYSKFKGFMKNRFS